jgi:chromosome segregation ATPase
MTSLTETLPILDEAVPALPGKLEAVAREGDVFHQEAAKALALFHQKRQMAAQLVEQVTQTLDTLQARVREDEQRLQAEGSALAATADEETQEIDQLEVALQAEGEEAKAALGSLETQLEEGTDRMRAAHEAARTALDALGAEARSSQTELDAAVDEMTAAVKAAQQAVADGQALVQQGVAALKEAMDRLLGEAQDRLKQTHTYLDDVRDAQEKAVGEALREMENEREQLEQEVVQKLDAAVKQSLADELEAALDTFAETGQKVVRLESETELLREALAGEIAEVEERVPLLEAGADHVKTAARTLGIDWP